MYFLLIKSYFLHTSGRVTEKFYSGIVLEESKLKKPFKNYTEQTSSLQTEFLHISLQIEGAAAKEVRKFMQNTGKIGKSRSICLESVAECMNNLVGDEISSTKGERDDIDTNSIVLEKYRAISNSKKQILCDFSLNTTNKSDDQNGSDADLVITMLNIMQKRDTRIEAIREKLQKDVSFAERNLSHIFSGGTQAYLKETYVTGTIGAFSCYFFYRAMNHYWPITTAASSAARSFPIVRFVLALNFAVPALVSAMTKVNNFFEQRMMEEENIQETTAKPSTPSNIEAKTITVQSDMLEVMIQAELLSSSPMQGPYVKDPEQVYRFVAILIDAFYSDIVCRGILLHSLMRYTPAIWAHALCAVTSIAFNTNYYPGTVELDESTQMKIKLLESLLLQLLVRFSGSIIPCLMYQVYVSSDKIIRHEFHKLDDPLMFRVDALYPVDLLLTTIRGFIRSAPKIDKPMPALESRTDIDSAVSNSSSTSSSSSAMRDLAETAMAEFSNDHYSSGGSMKKLSHQDMEDFLVALDWATVDLDSQRNQPVPINTPFPLRSSTDPIESKTLLQLLQLKDSHWVQVEIIISNKGEDSVDSDYDAEDAKEDDAISKDVLDYNSPEFLSSQLRLHLRRIMIRFLYPKGATLEELEQLLSTVKVCSVNDRAPYKRTPLAELVSSPHLKSRLLYAEELGEEAFMDLMQDRYAFLNREMDIMRPKVRKLFIQRFSEDLAGSKPTSKDMKLFLETYTMYLNRVRQVLDKSFLQTR